MDFFFFVIYLFIYIFIYFFFIIFLLLVVTGLVMAGDKQDEDSPSGLLRLQAVRTLCQMNPSQALNVRALCVSSNINNNNNNNLGFILITTEWRFFQKRNSQVLLLNKITTHTLIHGSTHGSLYPILCCDSKSFANCFNYLLVSLLFAIHCVDVFVPSAKWIQVKCWLLEHYV